MRFMVGNLAFLGVSIGILVWVTRDVIMVNNKAILKDRFKVSPVFMKVLIFSVIGNICVAPMVTLAVSIINLGLATYNNRVICKKNLT